MNHSINKLAKLSGISARTLRYYDEIGILKPIYRNDSNYRVYSQNEVDRLQQILFLKRLGVSLYDIKKIICSGSFDEIETLKKHKENLLIKRGQLDKLIENVDKTIAYKERKIIMTDKEKFEGFKEALVEDNEKKYKEEIRKKYGEDAVEKSNQRFKNMTQEEYVQFEDLGKRIFKALEVAFENGDPTSDLAYRAVDLHRQWLTKSWGTYSKEAHINIGKMYVDDERFTAYYDQEKPGMAKFLRDAIINYVSKI